MRILLRHEAASESVEVRELEAGTFEPLQTPLSTERQAAMGDIVLPDQEEDRSYRVREVVERPFRHVFRLLPGDFGMSQAMFDFGGWVVERGGQWEVLMEGLLIL